MDRIPEKYGLFMDSLHLPQVYEATKGKSHQEAKN